MNDDADRILDCVTTDEMLAELRKRHDGLLFVGMTFRTADQCSYNLHFGGGVAVSIGLAEYAKVRLMAQLKDDDTSD